MKNLQTLFLKIQSNISSSRKWQIDTHRSSTSLYLSILVLLAIWTLLTSSLHLIDALFLPSPLEVINSFIKLFTVNDFAKDIFATTLRVLVAFVLSIAFAMPFSILVNESKTTKKIALPYIDFLRYIPVPILIPLMILFFGLGESSKIALLFLGTVFQLVLLFIQDLENIPQEYADMSFTLHFTKLKILTTKILSALPNMYDNTRVSLSLCWSYVIFAELVSAQTGIGHMIKDAQRFSNTGNIYAGIIVMALIGFGSDFIMRRLYTVLFPYKS
ncbi:MAG: ABC transporter permease [Candidatus Pacebacteria bacterium]|nr:ABC transporter permease [Candidatus Paceibacterota bacterium]